ncbi:MAG: DNA methyltransferase, partial [Acidobacteria bacterium]|nr:DNA methyltransferase [Acidobacteriota bacterium]
MPQTALAKNTREISKDINRLRAEDQSIHDWYRFVLSFPPHLVRTYLSQFGVGQSETVLDPFCGTGTTLVECKKMGIRSIGVEANALPQFASSVKVNWGADSRELLRHAGKIATAACKRLALDGLEEYESLPLFK